MVSGNTEASCREINDALRVKDKNEFKVTQIEYFND